jgi:hypothetical protein
LWNLVIEARDARALLLIVLAAGGIVVMLLAVIRVLIVIAIFGASRAHALFLAMEMLHLDHRILHQSLEAQGNPPSLDRQG